MRRAAHSRAERGTSCWLAGRCATPNAYADDRDIAQSVRVRFARSRSFRGASLWITVQRGFVWVEGCAPERNAALKLERLLRGVPHAARIVVTLASRGHKAAYPTLLDAEAAAAAAW